MLLATQPFHREGTLREMARDSGGVSLASVERHATVQVQNQEKREKRQAPYQRI